MSKKVVSNVAISGVSVESMRAPIFVHLNSQRHAFEGRNKILGGVGVDGVMTATRDLVTYSVANIRGSFMRGMSVGGMRIDCPNNKAARVLVAPIPRRIDDCPRGEVFKGALPTTKFCMHRTQGMQFGGMQFYTGRPSTHPLFFLSSMIKTRFGRYGNMTPTSSGFVEAMQDYSVITSNGCLDGWESYCRGVIDVVFFHEVILLLLHVYKEEYRYAGETKQASPTTSYFTSKEENQ